MPTRMFNAGQIKGRTRAGLVASATAVLLTCAVLALGLLQPLQNSIEAKRFRLAARPASGRVLLAEIDEPSIRAVGVWPWSRATHAAIIDKLRSLGAADIAFDVDFSSPSPGDGDAALEAALKRADGAVILAALQQRAQAAPGEAAALIASRPLPRFATNAWEGSVDVWPDPDGRIRWFSRGEPFGATVLPSMATLLGAASEPATGAFLIDYGIDADQLDHVSVADLLAGTADPRKVAGHTVIVGATATELRDFFSVPRFGLMAGPTVQAMAVESLMQGRALQPVALSATLVFTALLLVAVAVCRRRLPLRMFLLACGAVSLATEAGAAVVQAIWPVVPVTAGVHVGLGALAAIAVATEIERRRLRLLAARREAGRLRVMLDRVVADNFAGIVVVDQDGLVRATSAAAAVMLGLDAGGSVHRPLRDLLPDRLASLVEQAIGRVRDGGADTGSVHEVEITRNGSSALLQCVTTVSEIAEPAGPKGKPTRPELAVCLTFQDVTAEREAQRRLTEMARTDSLSGLANRAVYLDRLERWQAPGQDADRTAAVLLFDVDRFKLVNDRLGHRAGDALIQAVAARVMTVVDPADTTARLGGDEFALFVERECRADVEQLAAALVHRLGGRYDIDSYQVSVSVSVGIAYGGHQRTDLLHAADVALYAAKAAGGDCARAYDIAMQAAADEGRQIEQDIRSALDRGEFHVVYQRQVDSVTEQIVGVEALARWTHPERGAISPALFIPVAERTGVIGVLGAWVLATACRDAASWPQPIKVSVNLSAVQLARAELADTILGTLADTALPATRLDLELTESLLMENDELVRATLGRLRTAGVHISLDDFGTGYSSLSYLSKFAIDKIKIDQSFVRSLHHDKSAIAIIRAVVGLAGDMGMRVNVEGVETREQLRLLQSLGCHEIQGYLHGRPEPSAAIYASLAAQVSRAA